ncbi:PREDICTED: protein KTI12 homolog [Drosophila arizonae]|uniref:Protein KTI12 homolog n=1 Tax=Drosophila arizonae TaxID=7263 RepID=A0ABM1PWD0_DROAR|nr:PREDICTED: protein KTI12 homolog [Drosophila arizonae]
MPIIVISGLPSSGKSARARELQNYFLSINKKVHLISENVAVPKALFEKNEFFADSQKEKIVRSDLKSEASRQLNKEDLVILDACNYIKGYRYEIFCMTKAARTTQCTLFTCIPKEQAWSFNAQRTDPDVLTDSASEPLVNNSDIPYTREIFDALCMRFEEPHGNNRWDSPLFVVLPEDILNLESIYKSLYETRPLPPNQSTQNAPLSATNYLFEVDTILQDIIQEILGAAKVGAFGQLRIQGSSTKVKVSTTMNAMRLNRLRQQFISSRCRGSQTTPAPLDQVPQLFVQFINANITGC